MIAREGLFIVAWAAAVLLGVLVLTRNLEFIPRIVIIVFAVDLFALIILFFRDPARSLPDSEDPDAVIVAPADGLVVAVSEVEDVPPVGGKGTQLSIFLSILDVHVNRVPASGVIEEAKYIPGRYLVAWNPKSSELNERAEFVVRHPSGTRILFRQIAGLIARRIVYHIDEGSRVTAGERFGIMKFGSRMDVVVPNGIRFTVDKGDRVKAGVTVVARLDGGKNDLSEVA